MIVVERSGPAATKRESWARVFGLYVPHPTPTAGVDPTHLKSRYRSKKTLSCRCVHYCGRAGALVQLESQRALDCWVRQLHILPDESL